MCNNPRECYLRCQTNADCEGQAIDPKRTKEPCCSNGHCTDSYVCQSNKVIGDYCDLARECQTKYCLNHQCDILSVDTSSNKLFDLVIRIVAIIIIIIAIIFCIMEQRKKKVYKEKQLKKEQNQKQKKMTQLSKKHSSDETHDATSSNYSSKSGPTKSKNPVKEKVKGSRGLKFNSRRATEHASNFDTTSLPEEPTTEQFFAQGMNLSRIEENYSQEESQQISNRLSGNDSDLSGRIRQDDDSYEEEDYKIN